MRSNRFHCLGRWLLLLGVTLTLSADASLSDLFTNLNGKQAAPGRPRRTSIIFIQCDSLGYLDLGCYGQKQFSTPNLDKLAAAGMLFTNYDANGADGATARAALLLGKDPAGVKGYLTPGDKSLAQILHASGYHTGLIGEWNFGGPETGNAPWQQGFDEFAGYFDAADAENYYADYMWRYAPKSILNTNNNQWETYSGREFLQPNLNDARQEYIPDLYAKAALNFVRINQPAPANHYQPFFLWLNYPIPRPNRTEAARTGNGVQVPTDAPFSDEAWPQAEKSKAAMISRMDADIGTLLGKLTGKYMTNNVAVFFSSATVPHKIAGLDPTFFPSVVSTNDVRLPLIACWPRRFPAGSVSGYHCSPGNFLATMAEIGQTSYPTNEVEPSLLKALYGRE